MDDRAPAKEHSLLPVHGPSSLASVRAAMIFLAVVVAGLLLRVFREFLSPLVVATFLLLLMDALARSVATRFPKVPRWARATVAVGAILLSFVAIIALIVDQGPSFANQLTGIEPKLDDVLAQLMVAVGQPPMTIRDLFAGADPSQILGRAFTAARTAGSYAVLVFIYLGFLFASRRAFSAKIDRLYDTAHHREQARRVFTSVRVAVEQYVRLQTFKALLIALVAFALMMIMGISSAMFVAFLVFLSAFVPIIGAFAGAIFPAVMALAQFGDVGRPALILALLGGGVFLIDNVLMPKLQGDELNIDPLLVLVSIGFWGFIMGPPGVLLSTPLTVTVMAVTAEFQGARWLAILISKDGEPIKDAR